MDILIPKEVVNDLNYLIARLNYKSGDQVDEGDCVAEIETSKRTFEIYADTSGKIRYFFNEGDECKPGDIIAEIC